MHVITTASTVVNKFYVACFFLNLTLLQEPLGIQWDAWISWITMLQIDKYMSNIYYTVCEASDYRPLILVSTIWLLKDPSSSSFYLTVA